MRGGPAVKPVGSPSATGAVLPVDPSTVHLWRAGIGVGPAGVGPTVDELERTARWQQEERRERFLASRAWLRVVLGRYLARDPGAVTFTVAARGKPSVVDGGDLCFSLSRSGGVALLAVTRGRSVGVDVEQIRDLDHDGLVERFFAPAEADDLRGLPDIERRAAFFHLWARKEAVVKATGTGLGDGLSNIDVRGAKVVGRWSVASLDVGPAYAAAVAVDGLLSPLPVWDVSSLFGDEQRSVPRVGDVASMRGGEKPHLSLRSG